MGIGFNIHKGDDLDDGDYYGAERKLKEKSSEYREMLQECLLFFNKLPNSRAGKTTSYKLAEKIAKVLK